MDGFHRNRWTNSAGIDGRFVADYALFALEEPFKPEEYLIANDLEEHTWAGLNLACIESQELLHIRRTDITLRRRKQIPPQVTLNLNNISFPVVNVPNLPPGVTPQDVAQMVQALLPSIVEPVLQNAATIAAQEFMSNLPLAGFEKIEFNSVWQVER